MTIWLTQWGSKSLGDQGYSPIEILRYYYGDDMYINTAEAISGIPSSWPGYTLKIGSSGNKVRQMQEQLNVIAGAYPAIPKISADGIYGPATAEAVRVFQKVFGLPQTGEVDYTTWYKISEIYVGVSRIAELNWQPFSPHGKMLPLSSTSPNALKRHEKNVHSFFACLLII